MIPLHCLCAKSNNLKLDVQGQGGGKSLDVGGEWGRWGVGGLENYAIFMDVICVSSLTLKQIAFIIFDSDILDET